MVGGQISSTQVKHFPPTSVQVTQLPCTNRTLYLDFPDLCLSFRMCVPLSWSNARSIWLLLSTFIFSPSTISFAMLPIFSSSQVVSSGSQLPWAQDHIPGPLVLSLHQKYYWQSLWFISWIFFCAFCSISTLQFSLSNINKLFQYFQI